MGIGTSRMVCANFILACLEKVVATKDGEEQGVDRWWNEHTAKAGTLEPIKKERERTSGPERETAKERTPEPLR